MDFRRIKELEEVDYGVWKFYQEYKDSWVNILIIEGSHKKCLIYFDINTSDLRESPEFSKKFKIKSQDIFSFIEKSINYINYTYNKKFKVTYRGEYKFEDFPLLKKQSDSFWYFYSGNLYEKEFWIFIEKAKKGFVIKNNIAYCGYTYDGPDFLEDNEDQVIYRILKDIIPNYNNLTNSSIKFT